MREPVFDWTTDVGCMADLDGIAADIEESVLEYTAACVPSRCVQRMRPHAVSGHVLQSALFDNEVGRSFFDQDSAGGVIASLRVERAAVRNMQAFQFNLRRSADEHREIGDVHESDVPHR